jgi:hypothetical protein
MTVEAGGSSKTIRDRVVNNAGNATFLSGLEMSYASEFNNLASGVIDVQNDGYIFSLSTTAPLNNAGTLVKSAGTGTSTIAVHFTNSGTVEIQTGEISFYQAYGLTHKQVAGQTILNGGNLSLTQGGKLYNIQGGDLTGEGTITGNILNAGGNTKPGLSVGTLNIVGNYTQSAAGALTVELGGDPNCSAFDQLLITGTASLNGTLNIELIDGCQPSPNDTFVILTAGQPITTTFADVTGQTLPNGYGLIPVYNTNDVTLQVVTCIPPDFTCDQCVNGLDLAAFVAHWQEGGCTADDWCGGADLSQDGTVNMEDFSIFAAQWMNGCP